MSVSAGPDPDVLLRDPSFACDPYELYDILLSEHRVYWSPSLEYWFVSGYEEVKQVLMDPIRYSSAGWDDFYMQQLPAGTVRELRNLTAHFAFPTLFAADPPVHTRLRRLVHRAFTPRAISGLRDAIQQTVDALLEKTVGATEFDVVRDLAVPLPVSMFAHLFGLPATRHDMLKTTSADFTRFVSNVRPDLEDAQRADSSLGAFRAVLLDIFAARRAHPASDLVTVLVSPDADGSSLSDDELLSICAHLLIAGHETTTNLIANGLLALLLHPDQCTAIRADPSRCAAAIEEMLRWQTPLQRVKRTACESVELAGRQIAAGDRLMLLVGAANRDPEAFANPSVFDSTREGHGHLALGHGIHFCLGAALARLEAEIAITTVLARFPELRLREGWAPVWNPSLLRGLVGLPVRI